MTIQEDKVLSYIHWRYWVSLKGTALDLAAASLPLARTAQVGGGEVNDVISNTQ